MKRTKISELDADTRKVMRALVRTWLEDSEPRQEIMGKLDIETATDAACQLIDMGLLRCKASGDLRADTFGFRIEVTPRGRRMRASL